MSKAKAFEHAQKSKISDRPNKTNKKRFTKVRKVYIRLIDTPKRSFVKSLVWRSIGILILGFISWYYTRDIEKATIVTVMFHVIRFVLYYFHERVWERIKWEQVEDKL